MFIKKGIYFHLLLELIKKQTKNSKVQKVLSRLSFTLFDQKTRPFNVFQPLFSIRTET